MYVYVYNLATAWNLKIPWGPNKSLRKSSAGRLVPMSTSTNRLFDASAIPGGQECHIHPSLAGSLTFFLIFTPTWGNDPIWRAYFSNAFGSTTNEFFMLQLVIQKQKITEEGENLPGAVLGFLVATNLGSSMKDLLQILADLVGAMVNPLNSTVTWFHLMKVRMKS